MPVVYTQVYQKQPGGSIAPSEIAVTDGIPGTQATVAGVATQEMVGGLRQTVFTLTNVAVAVTDNGVNGGNGPLKLYDFPVGLVQITGASTDLTMTADGGLTATSAVVASLGTAAAANTDATLTSTEADIIPSTACTLSSSAGTFKGKSTSTQFAASVFDGTSTPKALYLNFATPDAGITANAVLTVNGTVRVTWTHLGDN